MDIGVPILRLDLFILFDIIWAWCDIFISHHNRHSIIIHIIPILLIVSLGLHYDMGHLGSI